MSFCLFCKSATDHVLQRSMWSCGTHFNDPHWRTKECYKRELNAANERIKRLEEAVETSIRAMEFYGPTSNIANSCKLLKLEMIKAKEAKP